MELFLPFFWEAKSYIKRNSYEEKQGCLAEPAAGEYRWVHGWEQGARVGARGGAGSTGGSTGGSRRHGRTLSSTGESGRRGGPRRHRRRRGGWRCVLKVQAAASADGLDLGAEEERIIKIFPLNRGTFPRWEGLGAQVLLRGNIKGL